MVEMVDGNDRGRSSTNVDVNDWQASDNALMRND